MNEQTNDPTTIDEESESAYPRFSPHQMTAGTTPRGETLAAVGAYLQLSQIITAVGAAFGMIRAFRVLDGSGIADPQALAAAIGWVLLVAGLGLLLSLIGIVLLIIALVHSRYRADWFFWFLMVYGGLLLIIFPVGTPFGVFFIVYCLIKKDEFLRPSASPLTTTPEI